NSVLKTDMGTAAALLTVMRMMGMTVGLAALTSWGTNRFDLLVAQITGSFVEPEYVEELIGVGLEVFQGFFLAGMVVCLLATVPMLLMRVRKSADQKLMTD
ncbi:MAG: hypothetical protein ACE5KI_03845, partial [Dehalococcoidia bacterium]